MSSAARSYIFMLGRSHVKLEVSHIYQIKTKLLRLLKVLHLQPGGLKPNVGTFVARDGPRPVYLFLLLKHKNNDKTDN